MVTINYYLKGAISEKTINKLKKEKNAGINARLNKPIQLFLMVSGLGKRIQIYTKRRISQNEWDKEKQQVDTRKNKINGTEINTWLTNFKEAVIKQNSKNESAIISTTIEELRQIMDSITVDAAKKQDQSFEAHFERFLMEHKTGDGHTKKRATIQKYNALHKHLITFCKKKRIRLQLAAIDIHFLTDFKDYLVNEKKFGDNTVTKYIKALKTFIRFNINGAFIKPLNLSEVKTSEKEGEIYILSLRQLVQLQEFKLDNKRLEQCRDVFCFQCWTGQRYSDIEAMRREDIKVNDRGEEFWDFHTIKTGDNIKVPILEYADKILKKYINDERPLPVISNQKQNDYLKELGKLVCTDTKDQKKISGFDKKTKVIEFHDGKRKESYVPFYEILTTHVARKSYITNSLIIGVPERVVKDVSGHKSEKDFRRYVNLASSYIDNTIRNSFSTENIKRLIEGA